MSGLRPHLGGLRRPSRSGVALALVALMAQLVLPHLHARVAEPSRAAGVPAWASVTPSPADLHTAAAHPATHDQAACPVCHALAQGRVTVPAAAALAPPGGGTALGPDTQRQTTATGIFTPGPRGPPSSILA